MKQETIYDRIERLAYEKTTAEIECRILHGRLNAMQDENDRLRRIIDDMEEAK